MVEKDEDAEKMWAEPERIDKFVDSVTDHENLYILEDNDPLSADCKALRQEIDAHRDEAGTDGLAIEFDAKMTSVEAMLFCLFGIKEADTTKPYDVLTLLNWVLEIRVKYPNRHNYLPIPRADYNKITTVESMEAETERVNAEKVEQVKKAAKKVVCKNMKTLWDAIKTEKYRERLEKIAKFLKDRESEMGFSRRTPLGDWKPLVFLFGEHLKLFDLDGGKNCLYQLVTIKA